MIVITFSYILNTCEGKTAQRQTNDGSRISLVDLDQ